MKALFQAYKSLLEKHKDVVLILAGTFKYTYEKSTNNISMRCRQPYSERCSSRSIKVISLRIRLIKLIHSHGNRANSDRLGLSFQSKFVWSTRASRALNDHCVATSVKVVAKVLPARCSCDTG
jgi:hypothetical protein